MFDDEEGSANAAASQLRRFVCDSLGHAPDVPSECLIAIGQPAREIDSAARRLGALFTVVGTQGLRGVRRTLLGSTTRQLLRIASGPVLAVPPEAPDAPSRQWPGGRVVVAVDLDERATTDIRAAMELASRFDVGFALVHVLPPVQTPPWLQLSNGHDCGRVEEAEAELARLAAGLGTTAPVETHVFVGNRAEAIAAFAKERYDLVIVPLRRGRGSLRSRPGSITYELLTLAATPVLAMPSGPGNLNGARDTTR